MCVCVCVCWTICNIWILDKKLAIFKILSMYSMGYSHTKELLIWNLNLIVFLIFYPTTPTFFIFVCVCVCVCVCVFVYVFNTLDLLSGNLSLKTIVDLQCVSFSCTAKWSLHIYLSFFIFSSIICYYRMLSIVTSAIQ